MEMFEEAFSRLSDGIEVGGVKAYSDKVRRGRLAEEKEVEIMYQKGNEKGHLLYVRTFDGRKPSYMPWVEFFGIDPLPVDYFDSPLERALIYLFSEPLPPGGRIFVEYLEDEETMAQLLRGYPIPTTRLGYILFQNGFTWFKDWYFPEGLMEGNVKLQGEKPMDEAARRRHMERIYEDVEAFLAGRRGKGDLYERRAVERAYVLREIARGFA